MPKKQLYIKTYGCQMNVYDSHRMADVLHPYGYEQNQSPSQADLVILNTCHIREKAAEKMYSELGRIKAYKESLKKRGQKMVIAVAGCVGQAEGEEIFKRAPFVDIVVGPQSYQSLPELLAKVNREQQRHVIDLDFYDDKFDKLPEEPSNQGIVSFLSIQEGCDKFCTFCVVPYTRGAEYSRSVEQIYRDAINMVAKGAKEINLLGQNVNAWHGKTENGDSWNLGLLIKHLTKIKGLERIRYTTSHPKDMHQDLYDAHKNEEKLMPFLHLPIQSGSDRILTKMNRKHSRNYYFDVVAKLKQARPDMQLSSDIIVGFPGESDADFADTLDLVKKVKYSQCYSFKYSPRPGTPGAEFPDQIPEDIKDSRLQELQKLLAQLQDEFNDSSVNSSMPVLFEGKGRKPGQIKGKSPFNQAVHVNCESDSLIGQIKNVNITARLSNSLMGQLA